MLRKMIAISLMAGGLTACGEPNPIVGVWVVDSEASSAGAGAAAGVTGVQRIEFREDKLVVGSRSVEVTYEVDGDRVIVTETVDGTGEVYTLLEQDRLQKELPLGITVVYRREGATPPVAAEGAAAP
jgi:hypothetical protein